MNGRPGLRLASFNAASGRGPDGRIRTPALADATASLEADVVAVQEVDAFQPRSAGAEQAAEIAARCAGSGPRWAWRFGAAVVGTPGTRRGFAPAPAPPAAGVAAYGVALLTRHPVIGWHELRMPAGRGVLPVVLPPGARPRLLLVPDEPRLALAAVVDTPLGRMTVVCTHLSFVPTRAAAQLRAVRRWARRLPGPLVVLGDLNLPGPLPAALTGWRRLAVAPTYPAGAPRVQLDHILTDDPALRVRRQEAVVLPVSDHRALVVDVG